MQRFMGIEHVQNKRAKPDTPISFDLRMRGPFGKTQMTMAVASDAARAAYAIVGETVACKKQNLLEGFSEEDRTHAIAVLKSAPLELKKLRRSESFARFEAKLAAVPPW
jgi:hypothetical protein